MNNYYEYFGIFLTVILARFLTLTKFEPFKSYFSKMPQGDAAIYYMLIQFWRRNKKGDYDERCLITSEPIYYPNFFEKMFGFIFKDNFLMRYSFAPNLILFSIVLAIYMLFLDKINSSYYYYIYGILLFLLWIDHVPIDKKRIHFASLQPRYIGAAICSLYFAFYIFNLIDASYQQGVQIMILCIGLNISIFSRQVLVSLSILLSIYTLDIEPMLNLIYGILINVLIQGRSFVNDLKLEYNYHVWFYKNYAKMTGSKKKRNVLAKLITGESKQIFFYSLHLLLGFLYIASDITDQDKIMVINNELLLPFVLSVATIVFLTSLRYFAFLGESFRYISFTSMFIIPIVGLLFISKCNNIIIDAVTVLLLFANVKLALQVSGRIDSNEANRLLKFHQLFDLSKFKDAVWFGIPYSCVALPMLLGYGAKSMLFQIGNTSEEIMSRYFQVYPFLAISDDFLKVHGITHIMLDKAYMEDFKKYYDLNFFKDFECIEDDNYAIYKAHIN